MRKFLAVIAILAGALAVSVPADAMECVGVRGVLRYCPGRQCITDPCLVEP